MKAPTNISPQAQTFYEAEPPPLDAFDFNTVEGATALRDIFAEQSRAAFEQLQESHDIRAQSLGGVSGLAMTATADPEPENIILYFHGGAYVVGSPAFSAPLTLALSEHAQASVFSADYRLAPEHRFPAALDDALATYRGLLEQGTTSKQIAVCGDSAGGGLALSLVIALRDQGLPMPAACGLLSPWVDLTGKGETIRTMAGQDPMFPEARALFQFASIYAGDAPLDDPRMSPLFADHAGLPPLGIQVGSQEILLGDASQLAQSARQAGVEVNLEVYDGMWHVFQAMADLPEARQANQSMGGFLRQHLKPRA